MRHDLPGYDAWKTAAPDSGEDYELGLEHFSDYVDELCEKGHEDCDHALWSSEDDDAEFTGCGLGLTDKGFKQLKPYAGDCPEVQGRAEDFDAAEHARDAWADSQEDR